jgi:hypothetical protein
MLLLQSSADILMHEIMVHAAPGMLGGNQFMANEKSWIGAWSETAWFGSLPIINIKGHTE